MIFMPGGSGDYHGPASFLGFLWEMFWCTLAALLFSLSIITALIGICVGLYFILTALLP